MACGHGPASGVLELYYDDLTVFDGHRRLFIYNVVVYKKTPGTVVAQWRAATAGTPMCTYIGATPTHRQLTIRPGEWMSSGWMGMSVSGRFR